MLRTRAGVRLSQAAIWSSPLRSSAKGLPMPQENKNWFIAERSMAFVALLLTDRNDVVVRNEQSHDEGADLWVAIKEGDAPPAVQVKGTLDPDHTHWPERVKPLFPSGNYYLPACVFVVDVRQNTAAYAWLAEPTIVEGGVKLNFFDKPKFHPVDDQTADHIVNRVKAWYDAVPHERLAKA
jgi:hypothetical protein